MKTYWISIGTAKGKIHVLGSQDSLFWVGTPGAQLQEGIKWAKQHLRSAYVVENRKPLLLKKAANELQKYFKGELQSFSVRLDLNGTPFQVAVWKQLLRIPFGKVRSYKDVAQAIGRPKAIRAVGSACGANPISIIVPCHRVVGGDGNLGGYGGGLPAKKWLLSLEKNASRRKVENMIELEARKHDR